MRTALTVVAVIMVLAAGLFSIDWMHTRQIESNIATQVALYPTCTPEESSGKAMGTYSLVTRADGEVRAGSFYVLYPANDGTICSVAVDEDTYNAAKNR